MPKHKKFDKKKAVTFQLVHRSQQDPLVANEDAPQRVLLPVDPKKDKEKHNNHHEDEDYFDDDDCDYMEYLKDSSDNKMNWPDHVDKELKERIEKAKRNLPETVFASKVEDEVGMLAKAPPMSGLQLQLDPDVIEAMEEDFDFEDAENQLEDNFIELADGVASDEEEVDEVVYFSDDYSSGDERDDVGSLVGSEKSSKKQKSKSKFTNYSMTSSVIRRNEQLTLLDDRFEEMFADYDDSEIGAIESEEIEGYIPDTSEILLQYAEEFEKSRQNQHLDEHMLAEKIKNQLALCDSDNEEMVYMHIPEKEKWDCETIIDTYSNIYNKPQLIKEEKQGNKIKICKKAGFPLDVINSNKLTNKSLNKHTEQNIAPNSGPKSIGEKSHISLLSVRPKDETGEERRNRKKLLKAYMRERKQEKKMNALAFKAEAIKQNKIEINKKRNVQGNKIL